MTTLTYRAVGRTDGLDDIMQVVDGKDLCPLGLSLAPETAALFAASADMLEALKASMNGDHLASCPFGHGEGRVGECLIACGKAVAAIAIATPDTGSHADL